MSKNAFARSRPSGVRFTTLTFEEDPVFYREIRQRVSTSRQIIIQLVLVLETVLHSCAKASLMYLLLTRVCVLKTLTVLDD